MSYLTLALWAEGPSDGPFLRPLLRRVVIEHALRGKRPIDVAEDFIGLPDPGPDMGRDERICMAVSRREGEISFLFIHADAKGRPERARDLNVQPAIERIIQLPSAPRCIAVIPKHETEAWMLADRDALAKALGVDPARIMDMPALGAIERHNDPKQSIANIRAAVRRSNRKLPTLDLRQIGEGVRLDLLRQLDTFKSFETELVSAMRELRLI